MRTPDPSQHEDPHHDADVVGLINSGTTHETPKLSISHPNVVQIDPVAQRLVSQADQAEAEEDLMHGLRDGITPLEVSLASVMKTSATQIRSLAEAVRRADEDQYRHLYAQITDLTLACYKLERVTESKFHGDAWPDKRTLPNPFGVGVAECNARFFPPTPGDAA